MAKRITMMQRLVAFAMEASADELNSALETMLAIKSNRFPTTKSAPRKPRKDKGQSRIKPADSGDTLGEIA